METEFTEQYGEFEDWMVGEKVYWPGGLWGDAPDYGTITKSWCGDSVCVIWTDGQELHIDINHLRFQSRKYRMKVLKTRDISTSTPVEIEFNGRTYVLKED